MLVKRGFKVQDIDKGFASVSVNAPKLTTSGAVSSSSVCVASANVDPLPNEHCYFRPFT